MNINRKIVVAALIMVLACVSAAAVINAQIRVSVIVTETMATFNPYGDSVALLNSIGARSWDVSSAMISTKANTSGCWLSAGKSKGNALGRRPAGESAFLLYGARFIIDLSRAIQQYFETGGSRQ